MKTTIEISNPVLNAAKELAHRRGTTLRSLVEEGLRLALERERNNEEFRLRDASVDGDGLRPELADAPWETIRDLAYESRG